MKQKYEDILPLLVNRFDHEVEENLDEKLTSLWEELDNLLNEDKIPKSLLQAYKNTYDFINNNKDSHPEEDINGLGYLHNILANIQNYAYGHIRSNGRNLDLGNAKYEELSKQEAVNFLGLDIKVDNEPLLINDPFPYSTTARGGIRWPNLVVTSDDPEISSKIIQLRFIIDNQVYIIQRTHDGYFNPLIRTQIPEDAFERAGLPVKIAGNSGERTPKYMQWHDLGNHNNENFFGKSLNNVYVWIKLADKIFKTDEFDVTNNLKVVNNLRNKLGSSFDTYTDDAVSRALKAYLWLDDILSNTDRENSSNIDKNLIDAIPEDLKNINLNNLDNLAKILELDNESIKAATPLRNLFHDNFSNMPEEIRNKANELFDRWKNLDIKKRHSIIEKVINNSNLPERSKKLLMRTLNAYSYKKVDKVLPQDELDPNSGEVIGSKIKKLPGAMKFSPSDYWRSQLKAVNNFGFWDTGAHEYNTKIDGNYQRLLKVVAAARKDLILAQKKYNKCKAHSDAYDDEQEYQDDLNGFKENLILCQDQYNRTLKRLHEFKSKGLDFYDSLVQIAYKKFTNYYKTLQDMYSKIREIGDEITRIKNYSKEELMANFGVKSAEEIAALEKAIKDCLATKDRLQVAKQEHEATLEQLRRRIAEVEAQIRDDDASIAAQDALFDELNSELAASQAGVEQALIASYKARGELEASGNVLIAQTNRFRELHGVRAKANPEAKPLKDNVNQLLGDLNDVLTDVKLTSDEKEVAEDILDDSDALSDPDEE